MICENVNVLSLRAFRRSNLSINKHHGLLRSLRFLAMTVLLCLAFPTLSHAACANPTGSAGDMVYNDDENILQYCDDTNWIGANAPASGSGGCINPTGYEGRVVYNADYNVPQVCSGDTWVALGKANASAGTGGCSNPTGDEGTIVYNDDEAVMQYCDGSSWIKLFGGLSSLCNSPGDVCSNGTVYAGLLQAATVDIYVTRCDAGQTWDGSSCTGTRVSLPWNNGNNSGYVETSVTSVTDGHTNTASLITIDSDSDYDGTQPHQAAQYCADLVMHGYDDWYLPAGSELDLMYDNNAAIGNFDTSGINYWSSSEHSSYNAWRQRFSDGGQDFNTKNGDTAVRCARRE